MDVSTGLWNCSIYAQLYTEKIISYWEISNGWNGHVMKNSDHVHVFGTECYVYNPKQFRKKFDNKIVFGQMTGYLNDKEGYQVYMPGAYPASCTMGTASFQG